MAEVDTIRNTGDAYVSNASALVNKNFSNLRKLYVKQNKPDSRYAYLYFGRPFPLGAKIISAKFTLTNGSVIEGATVTASRISESWKKNKITWNNKPSVAGASFTCTKTGNQPIGTKWEFDITAMMQSVSDGAPWFGIRFTANDGAGEWFYGSTGANASVKPVMVIEWTEFPDEPINLSPSNGNHITPEKPLLSFDYDDEEGASAIQAIQVQMATNPGLTMNLWDSGWVTTTETELDLAGTSFPGAANGSVWYWRARVRDGASQVGGWSDVASFTRTPQGVVTINSPTGVSGSAYVEENTPPILWSFSGVQKQWQVVIYDHLDGNTIIHNSGKVTGTQTGWTPPDNKKMKKGQQYTVAVRIWDDKARETNGTTPVYARETKIFNTQYTTAVSPVGNLTASRVAPYHWTRLAWTRGTSADFYEVYAGDDLVAKFPADEVDVVSGGYAKVIRSAPPRKETVWTVIAIVNGRSSANNPTITTRYAANSAVLSETDGSNPIMFLNYSKDQREAKNQTLHEVMGNHAPVLIKQGERGVEGSFVGLLTGQAVKGVDVDEEYRRWRRLRKGEGRTVLLTILSKSFECFLSETNEEDFADNEGLYYEISFDFYQTDF